MSLEGVCSSQEAFALSAEASGTSGDSPFIGTMCSDFSSATLTRSEDAVWNFMISAMSAHTVEEGRRE